MKEIRILIPPSEGKLPGGQGEPMQNLPEVSSEMISKMSKVKQRDWGKILGVKGKALEAAIHVNNHLLTSKTMPAIQRYNGVVYKGIDYPSLDLKEQQYFNQHVRIVSALFGLVEPDRYIPDYKLKIDKLGADKYWKPLNQCELTDYFVLDCLPQAHKKAVSYDEGQAIEFMFIKNGKKISAGHHGKLIKGKFVRWLCQKQVIDIKALSLYREDGFIWKDGVYAKEI